MTTLNQVSQQQAHAVTVNENFMAVGPAGIFGEKKYLSVGLTFGYYGGLLLVNGVSTPIADGTVALTASANNYIERTPAGVVSKNTTGFTAGNVPLHTLVTSTTTITTRTDNRVAGYAGASVPAVGLLTRSVAGGANVTLTAAEVLNDIFVFTGNISANIGVIFPNAAKQMTVVNATACSFTVTVKTAAGAGVTVRQSANAGVPLICNGTDVLQVAPGGYESPLQTIASAGLLTLAHGLGGVPSVVTATLVAANTSANYAAGNNYQLPLGATSAQSRGVAVTANATHLRARFGGNANVFEVLDATTGNVTAVTNADWGLVLRARMQ